MYGMMTTMYGIETTLYGRVDVMNALVQNGRHPEKTSRPTFESIVLTLKSASPDLLHWSSEDLGVHPQANCLGADMSVSLDLYADLRYMYNK